LENEENQRILQMLYKIQPLSVKRKFELGINPSTSSILNSKFCNHDYIIKLKWSVLTMNSAKLMIIKKLSSISGDKYPVNRLWFAVLTRAIKDIDLEDAAESSAWLFMEEYREQLEFLCEMADVESVYVMALLKKYDLWPPAQN
jgi:hypothetical protein